MGAIKPDHLIYVTPDLEEGMAYIARLTGVQPEFGGQHPGRGSHNALLALGDDVYLEIIAPDPKQPAPKDARSFGLDLLVDAGLQTWAVRTSDIDQTVKAAREAGYDPGPILAGSRRRSSGELMEWRLTRRPEAAAGETPVGDWLIPFIIDWGDTPHPAASAPSGCRLREILAFHPDPDGIRTIMKAIGIELPVDAGQIPKLTAVLETPNGVVTLA